MKNNIKEALSKVYISDMQCSAKDITESISVLDNKIIISLNIPLDKFKNHSLEQEIKEVVKKITCLPILVSIHNAKPNRMIKYIVAVASGKGGVGKSSISFNLALTAQKHGLKVGFLDADIYGPSLPTLTNFNEKPIATENKKIIPHHIFGIKVMSIGFLVPDDSAVIWRGLMVQHTMTQLINDIYWSHDSKDLDILFIDMPPGTGDVQLTLAQKANIDGAVIVSTPHALALADVRRAISMFKKLNIPIIGCVENMSGFTCSNCNHNTHFGFEHSVYGSCKAADINYLGNFAYDVSFSKSTENGNPFVLNEPEHNITKEFNRVFEYVLHSLETSKNKHAHG